MRRRSFTVTPTDQIVKDSFLSHAKNHSLQPGRSIPSIYLYLVNCHVFADDLTTVRSDCNADLVGHAMTFGITPNSTHKTIRITIDP